MSGTTTMVDVPSFRSRPARCWNRADLDRRAAAEVFVDLPALAASQIKEALGFIRANGLTLDTVEQEDFRIPAFAPLAADLRRRLDEGPGAVVLRNVPADLADEEAAGIVAWGLANYVGRPIRQGLHRDRRLFTVTDRGAANTDPTRIGASAKLSRMHSDNGCLEPRPPAYIGLLCVCNAASGGDSTLISAETLHAEIARQRPDLLPLLYRPFHFRPPELHTWPAGSRTIVKPVFDIGDGGELNVHYARVMIDPGMEIAGVTLDGPTREALDLVDRLLEREDLVWRHRLTAGEFLFTNNLATLHGRLAYSDGPTGDARRVLKRIWLWRRHYGPGDDPVALDLAERCQSEKVQ
ncbi:MAG: TauD/TfdA family dioxygenase [Inquilinaceae bacterium]